MKKLLLAALLFLMPFSAYAQPRVCPSPVIGCKTVAISTNSTTVVKIGAGFLHSITLTDLGASTNVVTIYDGIDTSGTVIGVIGTTYNVTTLTFDTGFSTGLTIVMATGTAGKITVNYN